MLSQRTKLAIYIGPIYTECITVCHVMSCHVISFHVNPAPSTVVNIHINILIAYTCTLTMVSRTLGPESMSGRFASLIHCKVFFTSDTSLWNLSPEEKTWGHYVKPTGKHQDGLRFHKQCCRTLNSKKSYLGQWSLKTCTHNTSNSYPNFFSVYRYIE